MKAFRVSDTLTLVSKELVLETTPASTIDNGISKYKKGESQNWATIDLVNGEFIIVESLTKLVKERIGDIEKILADSIVNDLHESDNHRVNDIELIFDLAITQTRFYQRFFHLYEDRYFYSYEVLTYARMHSLVDSILCLKNDGIYSLKEMHNAMLKVMKARHLYNFKVNSFRYFKDKINQINSKSIESYIIHGNRGKPKENCKVTPYVKKSMIKFYIQNSPRLSYKDITDQVNHHIMKRGYQTIDISSTKSFFANREIQNRYKPFRFGKEWVSKYLDPSIVRVLPRFIQDKWEIDGTVLPFYVIVAKKVTRLWICIIVDVHSRKIIGYGIDYHETANLVFNTYRVAVVYSQCLPFEIVRDNAKAYDSKLVSELENAFESDNYKCFVRTAKVGNPRDKGTVEKVLDLLNVNEFSKCDGWIGDPWNSERELYRLESATIVELRKKINVKEISTIFEYVDTAINNMNNKIF